MSLTQDSLARALAGRFRVEREIGSGGWAVVYLAEDLKHRRKVALKVLRPELASAVGGERFEREIEVVAALRHPNILPLHDSGSADGFLYFVMPFVEGDSLRRRFEREGALPIEDAIQIGREVASALAYAHASGVVHRDIKPENILLDSGHAVVSDFGIARVMQSIESGRLTGTGVSVGTPLYMSPEQVTGEPDIDHRTDIYSLGCVLYEALAGDPPYTGSNRRAIFARKLVDPLPLLRVVRDRVPEGLEAAIDRALARVPADRYRSARELSEALAAVSGAPRAGPAAPGPVRTPVPRRRTAADLAFRGIVGLGGTLVVLFLAGLVSTRAFDFRLQMPPAHTPSRTDFLVVGFRALIPSVIYGLVALALFVGAQFILRQVFGIVPKIPGMGEWTETGVTRLSGWWRRTTSRARARTVSDLFLVGTVALSALVLAPFMDLLFAVVGYDEAVLACGARSLHRAYPVAMAVLVATLGFAWFGVFRWIDVHSAGDRRVGIARGASLAWIVLLVLLTAVPWRLLWDASAERLRIDGERAYLLRETPSEYVVFEPRRHAARAIPGEPGDGTERLGAIGYLFEEPEVFASGERECTSVMDEPSNTQEAQ